MSVQIALTTLTFNPLYRSQLVHVKTESSFHLVAGCFHTHFLFDIIFSCANCAFRNNGASQRDCVGKSRKSSFLHSDFDLLFRPKGD